MRRMVATVATLIVVACGKPPPPKSCEPPARKSSSAWGMCSAGVPAGLDAGVSDAPTEASVEDGEP